MAKKEQKKESDPATPSRDEQIGFHKGSLMTLSKERAELVRILGIVEQLLQMHATALQEMGVKLEEQLPGATQQPPKKKPPIEDIL